MGVITIALKVTVLAALASALFLGFSASATAQSPGLDQYTESIPGAGGNKTTDKGDGSNGGGNGSGNDESTSGPTLDSADIEALRSQGSDGERAADALEATSNTSGKSNGASEKSNGDGSSGNTTARQTLDPSQAEGKAPVEAVFGSMFGGDGGIALPLIMLAVLVGGLAILVRRKRRLGADSIGD